MKKTLLSLAVLCFLATSMYAQKKIKGEGFVKYEITKVKSDDPMAAMMEGTVIEMSITDKASRNKVNMMGGMVQMDVITKGKEVVTLANLMGNKMKMVSDDKPKEAEDEKVSMTYKTYKSDTKKILGYKCHKVVGTRKDGGTMTFYVTNKISLSATGGMMTGGVEYDKLGGFPLEMGLEMGGDVSMTFEAKKVTGDISKDAFKYDDAGYKTVTEEEFLQLGLGGLGQ